MKTIRNIYIVNLAVRKKERVLVFSDSLTSEEEMDKRDRERRTDLPELAGRIAKTGEDLCDVTFFTYPSLGGHGIEPPEDLWRIAFGERIYRNLQKRGLMQRLLVKDVSSELIGEAKWIVKDLKADVVDAIVALSNYSTSHTMFRHLLTSCGGTRYASMPLFDEDMFNSSMKADWSQVAARTEALVTALEVGETVELSAPNGTNLKIPVKGRNAIADTGILNIPGSFGNLPAGEAFIAPLEGGTEGELVLDWAPTYRLKSSVILDIKEGMVRDVCGNDLYADKLKEILWRDSNFRNVAELGIGTNDMARRADNILESEKIMGTIHIALGDNSSFGGNINTPFHQDYIVFNPTLDLLTEKGERKRLIDEGTLLVSV
ncbi:MAG: aminopeptidase [Thermodesulfobacteriota bacterium]